MSLLNLMANPGSPLVALIADGDYSAVASLLERDKNITVTPGLRTAYILASVYDHLLEPGPCYADRFSPVEQPETDAQRLFDLLSEVAVVEPDPIPMEPVPDLRDFLGFNEMTYQLLNWCMRLVLPRLMEEPWPGYFGPLPALPDLGLSAEEAEFLGNPILAEEIRKTMEGA